MRHGTTGDEALDIPALRGAPYSTILTVVPMGASRAMISMISLGMRTSRLVIASPTRSGMCVPFSETRGR